MIQSCIITANSSTENFFKGIFSTMQLSDFLYDVETLHRTVEDDARAAEAQGTSPFPRPKSTPPLQYY
jgi:hypothetical protein